MKKKASENKYYFKDFHITLRLLMAFLYDQFGKDAKQDYLKQYSQTYYEPFNQKFKPGDKETLINYSKEIFERKEWPSNITSHENSVQLIPDACVVISHIAHKGGKFSLYYSETYNTVYITICENTPFEYVECYNDETCSCKQFFIREKVG